MIQSGAHPELAGPVAGVEAALAQVKTEIQGGKIDPIATLQRVETAHQALDQSLTGIRNQQDQARRAQASLQQTIMSAQAQISATSDYITARRGGVGTEARTRLAESQRNLDYALSISRNDPVTALTYAQQAHALAAQAAQLAQSDVDNFGGYANQGYGGRYVRRSRRRRRRARRRHPGRHPHQLHPQRRWRRRLGRRPQRRRRLG